jgi:hypothetical protein
MLCTATQAFATTIELSATGFDYSCQQSDGPGIVTVYVRTAFSIGTTASRFRVQASPEVTWSYLSETPLFSTFLGDTQVGIAICYDQCLVDQATLVAIQYMAYGTSTICTGHLSIVPHPDAETVDVIDCNGSPSTAITRPLAVGGICACPSPHEYPGTAQIFGCTPLPVRASTWGAVKSLYRN